MIWAFAALALCPSPSYTIVREAYGVPRVVAPTFAGAFEGMGRAVAQDRLWQMEVSRRVARGRLAAMLGPGAAASDRETLLAGYTDAELEALYETLSGTAQAAFVAYAKGVNDEIAARRAGGALPPGYAEHGIEPEPWTVLDSSAIAVMLARRFGTGGAGELRNLALLRYLAGQRAAPRSLDVFDDLAWHNEPRSIPTLAPEDDLSESKRYLPPPPSRAQTEAHLASIPPVSILELLPAIRAASGEESRLVARTHGAPFETGSYCIVVGPGRSRTGRALLLSGPQMGHTIPSVVHETVLDSPDVMVAGADVPGVPAIVVGHTPKFAWGLTTGVADTADIVFAAWGGAGTADVDGKEVPIERIERKIEVKGQVPETVVAERLMGWPVVLKSRSAHAVFAQRAATWKRELESFSALYAMYGATSPRELDAALPGISVNFNLFFAFTDGSVGWRYTGFLPRRKPGLDPRLPVPAGRAGAWEGFLAGDAPRCDDPASGLLVNWNNKPAEWWPNGDTPAWGRLFRVEALRDALPEGKLALADLERAVWAAARADDATMGWFLPRFLEAAEADPGLDEAAAWLRGFDGSRLEGTPGALLYSRAVQELRKEVFLPSIGNLTAPALFETAVQPSVVANAIEGSTAYPYLGDRSAEDALRAALAKAWDGLVRAHGPDPAAWPLAPGFFEAPEGRRVPYSNRGTFLQVVELSKPPYARTACPPGSAESGFHASDQTDLAMAWRYKPVLPFRNHGR